MLPFSLIPIYFCQTSRRADGAKASFSVFRIHAYKSEPGREFPKRCYTSTFESWVQDPLPDTAPIHLYNLASLVFADSEYPK